MMENLLKELQEQDEMLKKIFARREELAKIAKENNIYNELWDKLHDDKKSHYSF